MIPTTVNVQQPFGVALPRYQIPPAEHAAYLKWLRYSLDFCHKYHVPPDQRNSLPRFLEKLREKHQTSAQQTQAARAITLYYTLREASPPEQSAISASTPPPAVSPPTKPDAPGKSRTQTVNPLQPTIAAAQEKARVSPAQTGASWVAEYDQLRNQIALRQYSPRTLHTYRHWVRRFQTFTRSQLPASLTADEVKAFLTDLAVRGQVSASTQNQAFNALLFFYRQVLRKDFGPLEGVVRGQTETPYSGRAVAVRN